MKTRSAVIHHGQQMQPNQVCMYGAVTERRRYMAGEEKRADTDAHVQKES